MKVKKIAKQGLIGLFAVGHVIFRAFIIFGLSIIASVSFGMIRGSYNPFAPCDEARFWSGFALAIITLIVAYISAVWQHICLESFCELHDSEDASTDSEYSAAHFITFVYVIMLIISTIVCCFITGPIYNLRSLWSFYLRPWIMYTAIGFAGMTCITSIDEKIFAKENDAET